MVAKEYVEINLGTELQMVKNRDNRAESPLDIYQQTIIYHYSSDGYKDVNSLLRVVPIGPPPEFCRLLTEALTRLPPCLDIVYRGVSLTDEQLKKYSAEGETTTEPFFVSASREKRSAEKYGQVLFRIVSKSGRDISMFTRHKESEVLFASGTTFRIRRV